MKDNVIIEKIWEEQDMIEIEIKGVSEFVTTYQNCYVTRSDLLDFSEKISNYISNPLDELYYEFGDGNSELFLKIFPIKMTGNLMIEMDLQIRDTNPQKHRVSFYVWTELGLLESFGKRVKRIVDGYIGMKIFLNEKWD